MARRNADGKELTWQAGTKRRRKIISGKSVYFGWSRSADDAKSYRAAVEKLRAFEEKRATQADLSLFTGAFLKQRLQCWMKPSRLLGPNPTSTRRAKKTMIYSHRISSGTRVNPVPAPHSWPCGL